MVRLIMIKLRERREENVRDVLANKSLPSKFVSCRFK